MPKPINWSVVAGNLAQAREELESIEAAIGRRRGRSEVALQHSLEHAYHHLNIAWNARRATSKQYSAMSDAQFNRWAKYPRGIEEYRLTRKSKVRDA